VAGAVDHRTLDHGQDRTNEDEGAEFAVVDPDPVAGRAERRGKEALEALFEAPRVTERPRADDPLDEDLPEGHIDLVVVQEGC
jgi:hypothetical protein